MKRLVLSKTVLLTAAAMTIFASSCRKKDSCTAPEISENIVGTWQAKNTTSQMEFMSNGTYTDDDELLFGFSSGGVDYTDRTYVISGDTLKLTVSEPGGTGFATINYMVTSNKCDAVIVSADVLGVSTARTLERQ